MRPNVHIGLLLETAPTERRVALTPEVIARLTAAGHQVTTERGAGTAAGLQDEAYAEAGAELTTRTQVWSASVVVAVNRPDDANTSGTVLLGFLRPLEDPAGVATLAAAGVTALAFELVPRITRAQTMDALSSQATVAGYQAVLAAAMVSKRLFPMLTTAAGTIAPARALVLGAGVAGLQAIATCRRLGAVVAGFDVRAAAAEQIRSLGATFLDVGAAPQDAGQSGGYARKLDESAERLVLDGLAPFIARSDVVICTAAIPGAAAPRLVTAEMVKAMSPGSVIVDLAATTGGNCELTVPGEVVQHNGVTIVGYTDLPSRKAHDASQMYARNVAALLGLLGPNGEVNLDDEILAAACIAHDGSVRVRN
jgi:NAD(P) transhydrogenase subunit alpha